MLLDTIGIAIKERRKELEITQPTLAELAEVSKNTIYKIERGVGNPSVKTLEKLLEILGLKLNIRIKTDEESSGI